MKLNKQELIQIMGGGLTAAFLNAIIRGFSSLFDLGKSLGSSIARARSGRAC